MKTSENKTSLFPCRQIPGDPADAKLLGLYRQAQEDRWLQRVKIPGGELTGLAWRKLAELARRFTPATPLHLTTRQDIEIHDLQASDVPAVHLELQAAGLSSFTAAGDTPRNTVVCPCSGTRAGSASLRPLARLIESQAAEIDGVYTLPRKFKMSLSCGPGCGQPWITDLGLVFKRREGLAGFAVVAAGSLGARPGTGVVLMDWLASQDVVPLVIATIRFFAAHGDRENRRKARLRHVRERMGDDVFIARLTEVFERTRAEKDWPVATLDPARLDHPAKQTLTFANGDVSPAMADDLAALAEDAETLVRLDTHHRVVVFGRSEAGLKEKLDASASLWPAANLAASVVACPGKRWCAHGLVDTNSPADVIRQRFAKILPAGTTVCISGCPNGCAHPAVADIGLTGRIIQDDAGLKTDAFDILTDGGMGRDERLAKPIATKIPAKNVADEIEKFTMKSMFTMKHMKSMK